MRVYACRRAVWRAEERAVEGRRQRIHEEERRWERIGQPIADELDAQSR